VKIRTGSKGFGRPWKKQKERGSVSDGKNKAVLQTPEMSDQRVFHKLKDDWGQVRVWQNIAT